MIGLIHFHKRWNLIFNNKKYIVQQASKWINAAIQSKECSVQERWILLEEEEGWENYQGRSHEAESTRFRGNKKPIDNYINFCANHSQTCLQRPPRYIGFYGQTAVIYRFRQYRNNTVGAFCQGLYTQVGFYMLNLWVKLSKNLIPYVGTCHACWKTSIHLSSSV